MSNKIIKELFMFPHYKIIVFQGTDRYYTIKNGHVCLFNNVFMTESECFNHINEYCKGWVQSTESCRKSIIDGKGSVEFDYLKPYENLYYELKKHKNDLQIN